MNRLNMLTPAWLAILVGCAGVACAEFGSADGADAIPVGVAKVDVTPTGPIQLINVKQPLEATQVSQKLYARAIAIGSGRIQRFWSVSMGSAFPRRFPKKLPRD